MGGGKLFCFFLFLGNNSNKNHNKLLRSEVVQQAAGSQGAKKSELGTVKADFCSHLTANNPAAITGSSHCHKQVLKCNYICIFKE